MKIGKLVVSIIGIMLLMLSGGAYGDAVFVDGFEDAWVGGIADGWVNAAYRHGEAPEGIMMQRNSGLSYSGDYCLALTADSVPEDWMWWAAVEVANLNPEALQSQYNPTVSVMWYDDMSTGVAGQVYTVPSWVNPYISGGEDWTDVQHGARFTNPTPNDYYYVAVGEGHPGWQDTGVARSEGWHQLGFQLLDSDGRIHFYVDNIEVGTSYRNDYTDIGTATGLYTMFQAPLSGWGEDLPVTYWDDFSISSDFDGPMLAPEPTSMAGLALLGLGGLVAGKLRRKKVL